MKIVTAAASSISSVIPPASLALERTEGRRIDMDVFESVAPSPYLGVWGILVGAASTLGAVAVAPVCPYASVAVLAVGAAAKEAIGDN